HIASGLGMGFWDSSSEAAHLNSLFLVQEYVQGSHMRRAISNALVRQHRAGAPGFYSQADAVRWCLQLAQALDYLHTRSPPVIHRDVKLENILLTGTDPHTSDVKLIDFGLAVRLPRGSMKEAGSFLPAAR
ncbi:protein kinase domain-containing protein, partial [Haematococcus lacustris]